MRRKTVALRKGAKKSHEEFGGVVKMELGPTPSDLGTARPAASQIECNGCSSSGMGVGREGYEQIHRVPF